MSGLQIQKYHRPFVCFMLVFILFSAAHAQRSPMIDIFGKKPKNFDKAPDMQEFQAPKNGGFKTNPTFFAAAEDDDRCRAIDSWLSAIRYRASQSPYYANRSSYFWEKGVLNMERVREEELQKFAAHDFRALFGKSMADLSEKEIKQIAKSLDKCSYQRWVAFNLETKFKQPAQLQGWMANFAEMEAAVEKEKAETARKIYREKYEEQTRELGYSVAELLRETDLYSLHAAFLNNGYANWCLREQKQAVVGLIFNIDENSPIENDEEYWESFESEMLPEIVAACGEVENVYVLNYVNGYYINYDRNRIAEEADSGSTSDVHSIGVYSANERDWIKGDKLSNLTVGYSQRTPQKIAFKSSKASFANDPKTVTIAGLRQILKARQDKIDAEEKIRVEKAAIAEKQRLAEEKRQAEVRNAQKRTGDRAKAAEVWKHYKKGARETYDFSGYAQGQGLENIYNGNFQMFTGKYTSDSDLATSQVRSFWSSLFDSNLDRSLNNMWNSTSEIIDIAQRRAYLKMAFFAYHTTYAAQCRANRDMIWSSNGIRWIERDRWGNVVSTGESFELPVRTPYLETYNAIYEKNIGENGNKTFLNSPAEFTEDFKKLIKAEGCASASLRHFEVNLYLANEWLLPAQELKKP